MVSLYRCALFTLFFAFAFGFVHRNIVFVVSLSWPFFFISTIFINYKNITYRSFSVWFLSKYVCVCMVFVTINPSFLIVAIF